MDGRAGGAASSTRLFTAGGTGPYPTTVESIEMASTGNSIDFGDLSAGRGRIGATSNSVRGLFGGGYTGAGVFDTIDYISIANGGQSTDFGDLSVARDSTNGVSNSHGGLNEGNQGVVDTT